MPTHKEIVEAMPRSMQSRPRNEQGYPVPWFTPHNPETGTWDFRYMGQGKIEESVKHSLCWTCGERLSLPCAFVLGPMCAVNRTSAEPPSHVECAIYAAKACPFLARPKMERPSGHTGIVPQSDDNSIAGIALMRNPGVALVWITKHPVYNLAIRLFDIGEPERVKWYAHSRDATREEILESMDSGIPHLMKLAQEEGDEAVAALHRQFDEAKELLPA